MLRLTKKAQDNILEDMKRYPSQRHSADLKNATTEEERFRVLRSYSGWLGYQRKIGRARQAKGHVKMEIQGPVPVVIEYFENCKSRNELFLLRQLLDKRMEALPA
jgi:hypothetical protein